MSEDTNSHPILEAIQNYECGITINGIQINPDLPNPNPEILNLRHNTIQRQMPSFDRYNQQLENQRQQQQQQQQQGNQPTDSLIKEKYFRSSLSPELTGVARSSAHSHSPSQHQHTINTKNNNGLNTSNDNIKSKIRTDSPGSKSDPSLGGSGGGGGSGDNVAKKHPSMNLSNSENVSNVGDIGQLAHTRSSPQLRPARSQSVQGSDIADKDKLSSLIRSSSLSVAKDKDHGGDSHSSSSSSKEKDKPFNAFSKLGVLLYYFLVPVF